MTRPDLDAIEARLRLLNEAWIGDQITFVKHAPTDLAALIGYALELEAENERLKLSIDCLDTDRKQQMHLKVTAEAALAEARAQAFEEAAKVAEGNRPHDILLHTEDLSGNSRAKLIAAAIRARAGGEG